MKISIFDKKKLNQTEYVKFKQFQFKTRHFFLLLICWISLGNLSKTF